MRVTHQDVVIFTECQQEDEHQERHEEHQAAAVAELDEDQYGQVPSAAR